jgi:hypothetical protein
MPFLEYHCDLPTDRQGGWLSPDHGPLPDHVGMVNYEDEQYLCALWARRSVYVALELRERERTPEEEAWVLKNLRGWILQTYCWSPDKGDRYLICDGHRPYEVPPAPARREEDVLWQKEIYRDLMVRSVMIATSTPIALPSLPTSKPR